MKKKNVHIHVGPHKTGSSAIQEALKQNMKVLQSRYALSFVGAPQIFEISKYLNNGQFDDINLLIEEISTACRDAPGDCIISCEDLSGDLPGRGGKRRPYPHLFRNLKTIAKALNEFQCTFYFFVRSRDEWIKSAYIQNLKYRQTFTNIDDFSDFIRVEDLWEAVLRRSKEKLGPSLVLIDYPSGAKRSSFQSLLNAITGLNNNGVEVISDKQTNVAPKASDVAILEMINSSSGSQEAKRLAKLSLFATGGPMALDYGCLRFPSWYDQPECPQTLPASLAPLWKRVTQRVSSQVQPNFLPDVSEDLSVFRTQIVDASDEFPAGGRENMANQINILRYRFRGYPEVCFLLGLTISYLRRATPHTDKAALLFQRLWSEEHALLLGILPTRWLISAFQTFLEHGANENQRVIGASAYFYSNMLKAYEAERALEGLPSDATYPNIQPKTKMGFAGLDRFKLGGSDLILNTNTLLLELSAKDEVAGRVVREFLSRAKAAHSLFSRMDKSRQEHQIDIQQFANCWSFFEEP